MDYGLFGPSTDGIPTLSDGYYFLMKRMRLTANAFLKIPVVFMNHAQAIIRESPIISPGLFVYPGNGKSHEGCVDHRSQRQR